MDKDPDLNRLADRFQLPSDPLAGVIERRRRRSRNRRIAGGGVGLLLAVGLIAILVRTPTPPGPSPATSAGAGPPAFGTTGLRLTLPPSYVRITDALAYKRYVVRNGGWGALGSTRCGWSSDGGASTPAEFIDQFAGAAYLDQTQGPSEPQRRLLVLRTSGMGLADLVRCETDVRSSEGGRLLQRTDVTVAGDPAVRLVFRGGSYSAGRVDLLYVIDGGGYRWAFEFTIAGVQAGALHQFDSTMMLTVQLPPG
jgi:hypothetical protein